MYQYRQKCIAIRYLERIAVYRFIVAPLMNSLKWSEGIVNVNPDQVAPSGAVCFGFSLFV